MDTTPPLPPEIWDRTPPEAQEYILELEARVTTLEVTVQDLMARLHQDSRTSSRPPSSDPPKAGGNAAVVSPVGVGQVGNQGTPDRRGR
jgi:hypothetical protein